MLSLLKFFMKFQFIFKKRTFKFNTGNNILNSHKFKRKFSDSFSSSMPTHLPKLILNTVIIRALTGAVYIAS